jgi:hypothetical protein
MFQLKMNVPALFDGSEKAMYLGSATTSRLLRKSKRFDERAVKSKFSYSSEILEKKTLGAASEAGAKDELESSRFARLEPN